MARLNANPNAEANVDFPVIKPCVARLRVKNIITAAEDGGPLVSAKGNTYWKIQLEYVDPTSLTKEDGSPVNGPAGSIFDNSIVVAPAEKQGKARGFVEALGAQWADLDSDDLVGLECDARIGIEEYQGNKKNTVARYLKKQ